MTDRSNVDDLKLSIFSCSSGGVTVNDERVSQLYSRKASLQLSEADFTAARSSTCPVCLKGTAKLFCPICINVSIANRQKCSFWEYKEKHSKVVASIQQNLESYNRALERKGFLNYASLQTELHESLEKRSNLRQLLQLKQQIVSEKRRRLLHLRQNRKKAEETTVALQDRYLLWQEDYPKNETTVQQFSAKLERRQLRLSASRKVYLKNLFGTVFPVRIAAYKDGEKANDVVNALAEASYTQYVNGRWVCGGQNTSSLLFTVAGCAIPDSSQYDALFHWLYRSPSSPQLNSIGNLHTEFGILAALAYSVQLTSCIQRVLDIRLPFHLSFVEFLVLHDLTEDEFRTAVLKLNANVAVLCVSQGLGDLPPDIDRPICNLYSLSQNLNNATGFNRLFTVSPDLCHAFARAKDAIQWTERDIFDSSDPQRNQLFALSAEWEQVNDFDLPKWVDRDAPKVNESGWTALITSATSSVFSGLFPGKNG